MDPQQWADMSDPPLRIRSGGGWITAGTGDQPLSVKMPGGAWRTFGGGSGVPLYQKQPGGGWRIVSREGFGHPVLVPETSYRVDPEALWDGHTGRGGYATATVGGLLVPGSSALFAATGGADYLAKEVGTANESGHYTVTDVKRMTHAYIDLSQWANNHAVIPYPEQDLPDGVVFPYDSWDRVTVQIEGYAEYTYHHNRAAGLSIYDIRNPGTQAAWEAAEYSLVRVSPSAIPTESYTDTAGEWTLATPLYHEPGGTVLLSTSPSDGVENVTYEWTRDQLDDDVLAVALIAPDRPADPPTDPSYSTGWTRWETFTVDGEGAFDISVTLHWPAWEYLDLS